MTRLITGPFSRLPRALCSLPLALLLCEGAAVAQAPAPGRLKDNAEPMTAAAVMAAADDWLAAEVRGDVAALDARLAPEYRDIDSTGRGHVKADLMNATARRKKTTESAEKVAADMRARHPVLEKVVIVGKTALLSYYSANATEQDPVRSIDVFAYDQGRWRGILSTHMAAPAPASQPSPS